MIIVENQITVRPLNENNAFYFTYCFHTGREKSLADILLSILHQKAD